MTLRQVIHSGPVKANELFARLAETGDGAVKTRERLFAELKAELELLAGLEEQHLFPVLRKRPETKALAADALADNKQVRALLAELEPMPKEGQDFPAKLAELRKAFQQHVRDEKRELLPAVAQALSEEEAQAVAQKIAAGKADAEEAQREEAEQQRVEARRKREEAERAKRQEAEAEQASREQAERQEAEAARQHARQAAEAAMRPAEAAAQGGLRAVETGGAAAEAGADIAARGSRQAADAAGQTVQQIVASASGATRRYHAAASQVFKAEGDLAGFWLELMREQVAHGADTFSKLAATRDLGEAFELQSTLVRRSFERLGRLNGRYLETVHAVLAATDRTGKAA
jgi:flagellar biosynthesis GTPase FlhF